MWLELLLLVGLILIADYIARKRSTHQLRKIPIVSKIPFIGSLLVLSSFQPDNLHKKFVEFEKLYGKTYLARLLGRLVITTSDPRYIDVILSNQKHITKSVAYLVLHCWLGDGLLISSGQRWQTMRKIITPTFHFKILEQFVEVFDRQSTICVDKLKRYADGQTVVDIYSHMCLLTLDIIAETAMGVSINAQVNAQSDFVQAVNEVTNIVATRFIRPYLCIPLVFRILAPHLRNKQDAGVKTMHQFTNGIIEQRRKVLESKIKDNASEEDKELGIKRRMALLDVLLQSNIDGKPLSDNVIRDEVNTFMFEGHDTTTSGASFCLYLLSRHAKVQQKLFEEIHSYFGDSLTRPITYQDLQELNYLNCVVKEALRLYPPVPVIGRCLKEDFVLDDITMPANTNILIVLWQLLRDPSVFEEPERFWPERHLIDNPRANAYSNVPFSAGPRNCIGQRFALLEMKAIVIKMLLSYELLDLGEDVEPSINIVLRSKTGVQLGIRLRKS